MMTDKKLQVTALTTDGSVDEVLGLLKTRTNTNFFTTAMFESDWNQHDIPKAVERHKMLAAGPVPTLAKKYEGKNRTLWTRKGVTLKAGNGVAPVLLMADGSSVSLKADLGYQHVVNRSVIEG